MWPWMTYSCAVRVLGLWACDSAPTWLFRNVLKWSSELYLGREESACWRDPGPALWVMNSRKHSSFFYPSLAAPPPPTLQFTFTKLLRVGLWHRVDTETRTVNCISPRELGPTYCLSDLRWPLPLDSQGLGRHFSWALWEIVNNNHHTASKIQESHVANLIFNQLPIEFIIIHNTPKQCVKPKPGSRGP